MNHTKNMRIPRHVHNWTRNRLHCTICKKTCVDRATEKIIRRQAMYDVIADFGMFVHEMARMSLKRSDRFVPADLFRAEWNKVMDRLEKLS